MNIGENLKKLRQEKGLTQEQLANDLNIELKTIRNYEQGTRNPKYEILEKLKNYFKCSYDDLLK